VAQDTASSTHRPHASDERGTPSPLSPPITSPGTHTRRAAPSTPSPVDPPQPAAPPQPILFTPGTDPAQLMQTFSLPLRRALRDRRHRIRLSLRYGSLSAIIHPGMMAAAVTTLLRSGLQQYRSLFVSRSTAAVKNNV
jgi:hypothetical protein